MRDVGIAIAEAETAPRPARPVEPTRRQRWRDPVLVSTCALLALTLAVMGVRLVRSVPAEPERRFQIDVPNPSAVDEFSLAAMSPDGSNVVFVANSDGGSQLWLHALDSVTSHAIPGTDRGQMPFWSPDNRSVGFFADGELKRVDLDGGALQTLAPAAAAAGGAWGRDGSIVFSANPGRPLLRMPASGGAPMAVTIFEAPQQAEHGFPQFLPDGRHFLFFVSGSRDARGVYLGQIDQLRTRRLLVADAPATYAATGHLLFLRQGTLQAQVFNPDRLELMGAPFPVADHLGTWVSLSASPAGPIAYRTPPAAAGLQQFVWVDRSGHETDKVLYANTADRGAALSPDGHAIALFKPVDGNMDIWSFGLGRRDWNRITFDSADDIFPVWSPNGRSIVFGSNRNPAGVQNLYRKVLSTAPGNEELLLESPEIKFATDWSADGHIVLYDRVDRTNGGSEIWALPVDGDRTPFAVVRTPLRSAAPRVRDQAGQISPDGQWMVYQSDRDGRLQVYVQSFPHADEVVLVSTNGGSQPRWNPRGKEVFYLAPDGRLMAVALSVAPDGRTAVPSAARALFTTHLRPDRRQQYMVSPDGQSFVMNDLVDPSGASPVTVILNWKPKR